MVGRAGVLQGLVGMWILFPALWVLIIGRGQEMFSCAFKKITLAADWRKGWRTLKSGSRPESLKGEGKHGDIVGENWQLVGWVPESRGVRDLDAGVGALAGAGQTWVWGEKWRLETGPTAQGWESCGRVRLL